MKHFLQEQAADGGGSGSGAAGGATTTGTTGTDNRSAGGDAGGTGGAGTGGASADAGKTGADGKGQLSLLAQATAGASPPGAAAANGAIKEGDAAAAKVTRDASVPAWVPEKFKTGEDFVKSYGELEARMKTAGLPPKTADEYKWAPPAGLQMDGEGTKQFREFALGLGLTQKQYEGVMGAYVEHLGSAAQDMMSFAADKAALELRKLPGWESDAGFQYNLNAGYKALNVFFPPEKVAQFEARNDPLVWELLSKIGTQLREDGGMSNFTLPQHGETSESLMAMPAYQEALKTGKHTAESQLITRKLEALRVQASVLKH